MNHLNVLRNVETRWLALSYCVNNIRRIYGAIILVISEEFNEIIPSSEQAKKEEEKLRNLLDKIANYRFIAFTHYFSDILQIIKNLSLEFQKENVDYSTMFKSIEICVRKIRENYVQKEVYGENYKAFYKSFKE